MFTLEKLEYMILSLIFWRKKRKPHVLMGFPHTQRHTHLLNWYCACLISVTKFVWLFEKIKSTERWKFIHILIAVMKSAQVFSLLSQLWTTDFFPTAFVAPVISAPWKTLYTKIYKTQWVNWFLQKKKRTKMIFFPKK